ncbi:MAG TPA: hypothetical protein VK817_07650 [Trebonia sp.]|jgi:hypothetical protein|nr:hypothetical protein [Trebonia sp.]
MIIDCDRCTLRGLACANCAVTFVTGGILAEGPASPRGPANPGPANPGPGNPGPGNPGGGCTNPGGGCANPGGPVVGGYVADGSVVGHGAELDAAELRALTALANAGMIPPLRYAPAMAKAS